MAPPTASGYRENHSSAMNRPLLIAHDSAKSAIETAIESAKRLSSTLHRDQALPELWDRLQASSSSRDYSMADESGNTGAHLMSPLTLDRVVLIPDAILAQYSGSGSDCRCFMGLLPQIHRAWMTIDSRLFLWDYANGRDLTCFAHLDEVIIDVGLVAARPGIFVAGVQHLLVIVTPVEVHLLAVTFGDVTDDKWDSADLKLHKTGISFPTDDINMLSMIGTPAPEGRIFMGGNDGMIYEFDYYQQHQQQSINSSQQAITGLWSLLTGPGRNRKICRTGNPLALLLLPPFLRAGPAPDAGIIDLTYDQERHILYSLSEGSSVQAFWLGKDGRGWESFGSINDIFEQAARLAPTGLAGRGMQLVSIHVIPRRDSAFLHLVAVAANGIRLFLSTLSREKRAWDRRSLLLEDSGRPECLELVHVRLAPEDVGNAFNIPTTGGQQSLRRRIFTRWLPQVHVSQYLDGLWIAASSLSDQEDALCVAQTHHAAYCGASSLGGIESFAQFPLEAKVWDICSANESAQYGHGDPRSLIPRNLLDLADPYYEPYPILVLSNAGIYVYRRTRPIEQLASLLTAAQGSLDEPALVAFLDGLGMEQSGALALQLASQPTSGNPLLNIWAAGILLKASQPKETTTTLKHHTSLMPIAPKTIPSVHPNHYIYSPAQSVVSNSTLEAGPLPMIESLYLYAARLVAPIWKMPISHLTLVPTNLCLSVQALLDFLGSNSAMLSGKQNAILTAIVNLQTALRLILELLAFISLCQDYGLLREEDDLDSNYGSIVFETLIATDTGRQIVNDLGGFLVQRQLSLQASVEPLCEILRRRCPGYFGQDQILLYEGTEYLERAFQVCTPEDRHDLLTKSLGHYLATVSSMGMGRLVEICCKYARLGFFSGIIDLSLRFAQAADPDNLAVLADSRPDLKLEEGGRQIAGVQIREDVYRLVLRALGTLCGFPDEQFDVLAMAVENVDVARSAAISRAVKSTDELFHHRLYEWLLANGLHSTLLEIASPFLEAFLRQAFEKPSGSSFEHGEILWKFYSRSMRYLDAARVLSTLAIGPEYPLDLNARLERLSLAVNNARSSLSVQDQRPIGPMESTRPQAAALDLIHELEERLDVAHVQVEVLQMVRAALGVDSEEDIRELRQLNSQLYPITVLYNNFARPLLVPEACLLLMHCAQYKDAVLVGQYWQQIVEKCMKPGPGGSKEGDGALWRLGQKLQELIPKLYPSDAALPVNYVVDLVAMVVYKHCGGQSAASWPAAAFIKAGLPFSVLLDTLHRLITEESSWSEQPGPRAFLYTVMAELIDRWMEAEEDPHKNIERANNNGLPPARVYERVSEYALKLASLNMPALLSRFQLLQQTIHQRYRSKQRLRQP